MGAEIEYKVTGEGEPMLFLLGDSFRPARLAPVEANGCRSSTCHGRPALSETSIVYHITGIETNFGHPDPARVRATPPRRPYPRSIRKLSD